MSSPTSMVTSRRLAPVNLDPDLSEAENSAFDYGFILQSAHGQHPKLLVCAFDKSHSTKFRRCVSGSSGRHRVIENTGDAAPDHDEAKRKLERFRHVVDCKCASTASLEGGDKMFTNQFRSPSLPIFGFEDDDSDNIFIAFMSVSLLKHYGSPWGQSRSLVTA